MADRNIIVRDVFDIPNAYVMSLSEEKRLYAYILETTCKEEANWFRLLDCSAFCREEDCYFCSSPCGEKIEQ